MPELRKDPIVGRWVIIATERARRPGNIIDNNDFLKTEPPTDCPYCEHHESQVPPEIYAVRHHSSANSPGWQVRVVPSRTPIIKLESFFQRRGHGLYDIVNGYGAHEVVIETPEHITNMADLTVEQIRLIVKAYALRFADLRNNPQLKFIMAYKNYSRDSNGPGHSRSQIMATPVNPMRAKDKLKGARDYFRHRERCIYCDLIHQELEAKKRVVFENDSFVALTPFASRFPFETWILPKKHHCDFHEGIKGLEIALARILKEILQRIKVGLKDPDYNYVIHTAPLRRDHMKTSAWKTIEEDYHWHIEVMPSLTRVAGFEKGTGFYICPIPPENTAEFLREVKLNV